ncbi:MAG: putative N-acetylmannosamine-6-phosphate 2-epimerase [Rhodobacter sp.]|nr:putative N-acetylmannosamine-6-phosphate 2-epimerase [Rhodobacter sp.]MCA3513943.1 putative N-acetylmannosamine-6-phosphate 2-epimerase [Rhodobacter sp.]MCA3518930.1 putative N-acetylmannosamine-6-phosphate 2-epimerase [Rhodobacter sp.]MCA3524526.1 putative N-acetylmannosamine-6-phosphate 2-epimerase [Rhodobacter sp.]MCA3527532.1 putative N-acetylmannosamine-6-phosphate 2-epimerase [Rhodobacter sp.]
MPGLLDRLRGGLVVSCQPVPGGPMDRPEIVAAFALAALAGGAAGLRIEGTENLRAVRKLTPVPIIGLVKRDVPGSFVRITPLQEDVLALAEAGADIIAFDATDRDRPVPRAGLVAAIHGAGCLAMADCAFPEDGIAAHGLGVAVLGSTLSGYTGGPVPEAPDLHLVTALRKTGGFVIAEGRYHSPALAARAVQAGADAVVVGSAITRTEHVTGWFADALAAAGAAPKGTQDAPSLAVDLGGSKLLVALVQGATVLDRIEAATDRDAGPEAWVRQMADLARPWTGRFASAGVTVTGLIKDNHWRALNPGTLAFEGRFPLHRAASTALGVPVALANDAQAAAWGEFAHGAGEGKDVVFLTVSTGVGGGVVANGRLLQGRGGVAGHFGQVMPLPEGDGTRFEDGASGRWIAAEGARLGLPPDARAVFAAAAAGNAAADAVIETSARRVARLAHDLQLMFDPRFTVIGGGVGLASGYIDRVARAVAHLQPLVRPTLRSAALGRDAGVIGIADLSRQRQPNREENP